MKKIIYKLFPDMSKKLSQYKRKRTVEKHKKYTYDQMEEYISSRYFYVHKYEMDWATPKSYTQKIQFSKLYNKDPLRTICSDKIAVRNIVKDRIGEEYLIPIYGIWNNFSEIDFEVLPNQFVLKTNHGSATNIIVTDKSSINMKSVQKTMERFLKDDFAYYGFELHYAGITPQIYAEKLLHFDDSGIEDYKFLCFNGEIYCFWIDFDRQNNHRRNMYDLEWNLLPWNQWSYGNSNQEIIKPDNFDEMVMIVKELCKGFDHVRVDLYNTNNKIYFGELTFTNGGGYEPIYPKSMDFELGKQWDLSAQKMEEKK